MPKRVKKVVPLQNGEGKRKNGAIMGIDVHRSILAVCILNETSFLYEQNHTNDKTGLERILKLIKKFKVQDVAIVKSNSITSKRLQKVIDFNIKGYNSKIANYQSLQEKLTELMNKDISELDKSIKSIKQLKLIFNLVL